MLKGLEIIEVNLSKAIENKDLRIDSDFWTKEPRKNSKLKYEKIGALLKKSQYGISISMNGDKIGYPIYRMNEIHNMMCDLNVDKYADISKDEFEKFKLNDRDVLFNRTNSYEWVGRTGIYRKTNEQEFIFASYLVRFVPDEKIINPEYLIAYLNTKYGEREIKRRARRSINQTNVNPEEVKEIYIPLLCKKIQNFIKNVFSKAHAYRLKSDDMINSAKTLLLETIGLKKFTPNAKAICVKNFKNSYHQTGRLDAEYYQPKYVEEDNLIEQYPLGFKFFKDLVISYEKGQLIDYTDKYYVNSIPYILIENLRGKEYQNFTLQKQGTYCTKDDLLIVGDGSNSGEVGTDLEGFVGSTLYKITLKKNIDINKYSLMCILHHYYSRLNYFKTGSGVPHLDKTILDNLRIPIIDDLIQSKIDELVRKSLKYQKEYKKILELSKKAIEIAIEQDEESAAKWIQEQLNVN